MFVFDDVEGRKVLMGRTEGKEICGFSRVILILTVQYSSRFGWDRSQPRNGATRGTRGSGRGPATSCTVTITVGEWRQSWKKQRDGRLLDVGLGGRDGWRMEDGGWEVVVSTCIINERASKVQS
jgi:hypothetical protein